MSEGDTTEIAGDSRRQIGVRIHILARLMRNRFDRLVAGLNITRSQWQMIAMVSHNPGATQRTIAEALEMSEASAGRLIDRLCADGLLERQERYDDRRARAVYVTKASEPLLAKLAEVARDNERKLFRGFSDADVEQLRDYLDRLSRNLS